MSHLDNLGVGGDLVEKGQIRPDVEWVDNIILAVSGHLDQTADALERSEKGKADTETISS